MDCKWMLIKQMVAFHSILLPKKMFVTEKPCPFFDKVNLGHNYDTRQALAAR